MRRRGRTPAAEAAAGGARTAARAASLALCPRLRLPGPRGPSAHGANSPPRSARGPHGDRRGRGASVPAGTSSSAVCRVLVSRERPGFSPLPQTVPLCVSRAARAAGRERVGVRAAGAGGRLRLSLGGTGGCRERHGGALSPRRRSCGGGSRGCILLREEGRSAHGTFPQGWGCKRTVPCP